MNNIYKVIWSKAKNCYVVASEIARSHTKSASGSEKIGGGTRRKLLASLMALSLLCGGLGVASAADGTVNVEDIGATTTSQKVYTAGKVDTLLNDKADKTALDNKANAADVESNKTAISDLKNAVGGVGSGLTQEVLDQKADIAANKANITALQNELGNKADKTALNNKADKATTLAGYGITDAYTKDEVNNALNDKANKTTVNKLVGHVGDLETTVGNASRGLVKEVNDLKAQGNTLNTALGNKADKADLNNATKRITTNEDNIAALKTKTAKLSPDGKELTDMTTVSGTNVEATDVLTVKGEIKNGAGVSTTLAKINDSMTQTTTNKDDIATNKGDIATNKANIATNTTAINDLKTKTTNQQNAIDGLNAKTINITHDAAGTSVDGVTFNAGKVTGVTSIDGTVIGTKESGAYIHSDHSIWGNMKIVDTQVGKNAKAIAQEKTDREKAIAQEKTDREKAIGSLTGDKNYIKKANNVSDNLVELDKQAKTNADNIQTNANNIKTNKDEIARVNGELVKTNAYFNKELGKTNDYFNKELGKTNAYFNKELGKTNAALQATNKRTAGIGRTDTGVEADNQTVIEGTVHFDQKGNMSGVKDLQTDTIHANGEITSNGLNAGDGEIKTNGKVSAGNVSTGTLETTGDATIGRDLTVKGILNTKDVTAETIHVSKSEDTPDYTSKGSIIGEGGHLSVSNEKTDKRTNITKKSELNVNEEGTVNWATSTDATGNVTEGRSEVTADNIKNSVKKTEGGKTFGYEENITAGGKGGTVTDKAGNTTYTKVTATENSFQVQDKDGKNKNHQVNTKDSSVTEITNAAGATTKTEQTATDIKNTAKDGTITNEAKDIVNTATTMKTTVTGKATESYGELETTVDGQATENFNGGLDTNVTGKENHTVTGDQNIHVTGKQTNEIGGNQENTIGGSQTTTVTGKVTENYKAGQETNVTGDQDIKVSGTQTTTATDINRNASSGMIDTIDNDYGTNTETKVAGKTTTDVSIKGTGEEGKYIRGANESRDYLIKGTLKNSETKTVEKTSTEITDGNGNTSATIQDKTQISGSVTNGTSSAVSNVKADSIDTAVKEGTNTSLISQKKDSITSAVGNGTTSTVIQQGDKDITIASNGGTVGIVGKDIINNATNEITNTAGTKITDQVGSNTRVIDQTSITDTVGTANRKIEDGKITDTAGDSTVVTENEKGTTFTKTGSTAYSTEAGAPKDTNIAGNHISTGRVDANELGVSDVDGTNTADFSVKAGEGVKASAGNGTTTGSLDVTADEVGSTVKDDASGNSSTFKQRIDKIMGNVKTDAGESEVTQKGDDITSVVGKGEATNSRVTQKKGSLEAMVTNGTNINDSYDTADASAKVLTDGTNTSTHQQTASLITTGVKDGAGNENASAATATSSANTIKNGTKANTVISTADGTSFINSDAMTPVTGASGAGDARNTTIKGNTITTGKVTMDYADVMRDLGVHGNATVDKDMTVKGNTTLGEAGKDTTLTVNSKATFNERATFEQGAEVKNGLTVSSGGLNVTGESTFNDKVTMKNGLDVTGGVASDSFTVKGTDIKIDSSGINAGGTVISNVADGSISEGSKDAVNGGQLYGMKMDLEHKVDKVGANAAAMANLHPMEFDPDSKWNIAAAMGNYGSETATAIGAFYRPNEDVMVNFSTAFGTGENMVGGGVSVRLGKGSNKLSREESNALKNQVDDLTARMDALLSVLNPNMSKDFPDVPENHWAYEAVSRLAGNDIVQGYPDGEFHGDRTMTRYEMAEIIYNALSRGAEAERELVEEFKPELQAMAASEKATAERAEG